jgi:hypothetical protein
MPLQIRRGTEAERTSMTQPLAAGELTYVTDQRRLYVGDGVTVGGLGLGEYSDEAATAASAALFTSGTHSGITFDYNELASTINATVIFPDPGNASGDVRGSVFADDSTLLVDGVSGRIVGPVFADVTSNNINTASLDISNDNSFSKLATISSSTAGGNVVGGIDIHTHRGSIVLPSNVNIGDGILDLVAKAYHTGGYRASTLIRFRTDPRGTIVNPELGLPGSILFSTFDDNGIQSNFMELDSQGRLTIGGVVGLHGLQGKLRISGGITATNFVMFGSLTSTERNALTAENGMVIYNTSNNKFEGYQNGTWINLDDGSLATS